MKNEESEAALSKCVSHPWHSPFSILHLRFYSFSSFTRTVGSAFTLAHE